MTTQPRFPLLRLVLPAATEWTTLSWYAFSSEGRLAENGQAVLDKLPGHDELEIVLPARRLSAHKLVLPERAQAKRHMDALIVQGLEDRLLGDKSDALFVPGPQNGSERLVWVCSKRWIEEQLVLLTSAELHPGRLYPEYELLPASTETAHCASTPDGVIFRTADDSFGIVRDETPVPFLIGSKECERIPDHYRRPSPAVPSDMLASQLAHFRYKAFDPRVFRTAVALLALSGILLLLGSIIHWRQLENRQARLEHDIRQTFASAFPGTPIVDPILQWESRLRQQNFLASGDALDAVLDLANRINAPIRPRQLEARDGIVRITLSDTEKAQFKTQLERAGSFESTPGEFGMSRLQFSATR